MVQSIVTGLGFGLSLIIAIGAQNAYVLRQGLRREHVVGVVLICIVSDALLIAVGVAGFGQLVEADPLLLVGVRIFGAGFLLIYAMLAARRAIRPRVLDTEVEGRKAPLWAVLGTAAALTWLNPHVYLDTVVLLGSVSAAQAENRWWFGLGAALGSIVWFTALGLGARLLRPIFAKPGAWRALDAMIAVVMTGIAISLLVDL